MDPRHHEELVASLERAVEAYVRGCPEGTSRADAVRAAERVVRQRLSELRAEAVAAAATVARERGA